VRSNLAQIVIEQDFLIMKTIKTFIKFIELILSRKKSSPLYEEKFFVFIDNKFENYFDQIKVFFESGFLDKEKTILVAKFYRNNFFKVNKQAKKIGLKTHFYLFYKQIPDINGKVMLYPYNAQVNCRLILNRDASHIFLTHGESNKKASVNRMVRLYDHVLASGDISCDRYLENKIFTESDLLDGRVIKVGSTLSASCFEYLSAEGNNDACIAYLPTWEGGNEEENFSSLASPHITFFLRSLCEKMGASKIIIKPHPNTGGRVASYKRCFWELINSLQQSGIEVYIDSDVEGFRKSTKKPYKDLSIKMGVCDVSASEFMLVAKKIPSIVVKNGEKKIFTTKRYMELRENAIVDIQNEKNIDEFFINFFSQLNWKEITDEFYSYSFSKENFIFKEN
jgi:hypothetical protein